jgi:hypothetical protein
VCTRGSDRVLPRGPSTSPLEGLFGRNAERGAVALLGACCEEPFVAAAQLPTRNSSGCAAASAVAFCVGGFDAPDLSLDVGAARGRAVRHCQGAQVPSFRGNSSPSNHRSSGP